MDQWSEDTIQQTLVATLAWNPEDDEDEEFIDLITDDEDSDSEDSDDAEDDDGSDDSNDDSDEGNRPAANGPDDNPENPDRSMRLIANRMSPPIDLTDEDSDDEGGSAASHQTIDLEDDDNMFIPQSPSRPQIRFNPRSLSASVDLTMDEDESTEGSGSLQGEASQSSPNTIYTSQLVGSAKRKFSPSEHSSSSRASSTDQKRQKVENTSSPLLNPILLRSRTPCRQLSTLKMSPMSQPSKLHFFIHKYFLISIFETADIAIFDLSIQKPFDIYQNQQRAFRLVQPTDKM